MQKQLKRKSQSLPRLKKIQLQQKSYKLTQLFKKQSPLCNLQEKSIHEYDLTNNFMDPQQVRKQKVNSILLKSKSMVYEYLKQVILQCDIKIQRNKQKIDIAKKFRILKQKKSIGPFLTGVDIYKQEQQSESYKKVLQSPSNKNDQEQLRKILDEKYDDLAQLRKMIKNANKNLGAYKQQTLSIQKNLISMADKYGDVAVDVLSRKKITPNIYQYKDQII